MKIIKPYLIIVAALFIMAAAPAKVYSQDAASGASNGASAEPDTDGDGVPDSIDKCQKTPPRVVVDAQGCFPDADGDGVSDAMDKCPGTSAGTVVDASGCVPDADSDGDGISDSLDKCPKSPARVVVDVQGCFPDEDSDGISDSRDKCPGTPAGAGIDSTGCSADQLALAAAQAAAAAASASSSAPAAVAEDINASGAPAGVQTVDSTVLVVSPGAAPSPAASAISAAADHSGGSAEIKAIRLPQAEAPSAAATAAPAAGGKTTAVAAANAPAAAASATPAVKSAVSAPIAAAVSAEVAVSAALPAGKKAAASESPVEAKAVARLTQEATPGSVTPPVITAVRAAAADPSCPWAQEDKLCMIAMEFDLNKAALKGDFAPRLKAIKEFLAANPKAQIELHGHTDSTGPNDYNVKLSMGRAEAIKKYLIKEGGLDAGRITTRGLGKSLPTAANDTKQGRASNRRTLVVLSLQSSR